MEALIAIIGIIVVARVLFGGRRSSNNGSRPQKVKCSYCKGLGYNPNHLIPRGGSVRPGYMDCGSCRGTGYEYR